MQQQCSCCASQKEKKGQLFGPGHNTLHSNTGRCIHLHTRAITRGGVQAPRATVYSSSLSMYASIGGQEHTRLRSPHTLSTRPTCGQNLWWRT